MLWAASVLNVSTHFSRSTLRGAVGLGSLIASASVVACAGGQDPQSPPQQQEQTQGPQGLDVDAGNPGLQSGGDVVQTCEDAARSKAYVGCDFWPTVAANTVWSIFDFAVVVANAGSQEAQITVTGNGVDQRVTVAPGGLTKIYLPWNAALKGPDSDNCGAVVTLDHSVRSNGGAYHLVSSVPVTVYQFNPLEYRPKGGPTGKSWSSCPGKTFCMSTGEQVGCYSFSNDASLLLPSTALTGNYRVTGIHGWSREGTGAPVTGSTLSITATRDATTVNVKVGANGSILAGDGVIAAHAGDTVTFTMSSGDVVELVGEASTKSDLSGSLVTADKPVQVIAGNPCIQNPIETDACDHVEESVFPAETLGKDYVVTVPTSPNHDVVGHTVRFYGNVDGTHLSYAPKKPDGAPDTLDAGQVVEVPAPVSSDFRVTGDHEFAVGSFQLGALAVDGLHMRGDPSMSFMTSTEQYRTRYVFLAPDDYDVSYVDIVYPTGAELTLDGFMPTTKGHRIENTEYSVMRVRLSSKTNGVHDLVSTKPVGIQVIGYGSYTSYQFPGGLDLKAIAPPPVR